MVWARVFAVAALAAATGPFADMSPDSGVSTVLKNSLTEARHQIETMPGGVALLDYDNDGLLDIFLSNGAPQPSLVKSGPEWWNRLYRNKGGWRFEDVTEKAGLAGEGYSMGVAAADYDNDGFTDLFVTGVGVNSLYRNKGDGTFERKPFPSTVWSISAGWFDADNDGDLDLFIVNYVVWDPAKEPYCGDRKAGYRTYCHPKYYEGLPNSLFRNNSDGTFTDVSKESGIGAVIAKGMAVAFADYNGDGLTDVFVTSDTTPDLLFRNDGKLNFTEVALRAGVAMSDDGRALSSMGADFRDIDNDGLPDIFMTALANETFPFYHNQGEGYFVDRTYPSGVGRASLQYSGWSCGVFDFDNDGWKDLFAATGDVNDNSEIFSSIKSRQQSLILWNQGGKSFRREAFGEPAMHRGTAFGDIDGDGRIDVVITRLNQPPLILRNTSGAGNNWIGFRTGGPGATIRVKTKLGSQWNQASSAVGYLGSSDPTVHFGLGKDTVVEEVEITWPGGKRLVKQNLEANRYWAFRAP